VRQDLDNYLSSFVMLNVWISNLSDADSVQGSFQSDNNEILEDTSISPLTTQDWDPELLDSFAHEDPLHTSAPVANFPPGALFTDDDNHSAVPVVSTEGGSSEFAAPDSMPSARFFYSNTTSQRSNHQQNGVPEVVKPHSSSNSSSHSSRSNSHPQIHVQVNLPGSANGAAPAVRHPQGVAQNVAQQMDLDMSRSSGHQPFSPDFNAAARMNFGGSVQRADVPMLFHGCSISDNTMYNNVDSAARASGTAHATGFYSAFQPEVDFLEFQSMYFHLCKFYYTYGHSNVPKHGDCFVLGSWVEKLRQRKHIQDLQESGICVAASLDPISKRQTELLESLGFRWHISTSENNMIVQHLMFVDKAQNAQHSKIIPMPSLSSAPNMAMNAQKQSIAGGLAKHGLAAMATPSNMNVVEKPPSKPVEPVFRPVESKPPVANTTGKRKKKVIVEHESISRARLEQQQQDIKVCEGLFAQGGVVEQNILNLPQPEKIFDVPSQTLYDPALDSAEHLWKNMYKKLAEYKKNHGDCAVPARYNEDPKLGHWVMTQRRQFNLMKKGQGSSMSLERMKLLNDLEFSWSIRIDPEKMWNLRFEQLQQYRKKHGDCLVPQRYTENPKLGTW
jgi:hypothetical protein